MWEMESGEGIQFIISPVNAHLFLPASHVFYFDSSTKCLNQRQGELCVDSAVNHDDGDDDGDDDISFRQGKLLAPWVDNIHFLFL